MDGLGYFILNHDRLAGSQALLAQVWKEYALSDSRYLTSDPFTLCVETVTVVWRGAYREEEMGRAVQLTARSSSGALSPMLPPSPSPAEAVFAIPYRPS